MTLICQKEIEICESIQKNLDSFRKICDSVDMDDIDINAFARETLQKFDIDYSFDYWELRSLKKLTKDILSMKITMENGLEIQE